MFFLYFKTKFFHIKQQALIIFKFYKKFNFFLVDSFFLFIYFFLSPYKISKRFLKKKTKKEIHIYGETPLLEFYKIAKKASISKDCFLIDLGSGRSRIAFFSNFFIGCRVLSVEWIPIFVKISKFISSIFRLKKLNFLCCDILDAPFEKADFVYLYGTDLKDDKIKKLIKKMTKMRKGSKVITISYPLSNYDSDNYYTTNSFSVEFDWGKTFCYINLKK